MPAVKFAFNEIHFIAGVAFFYKHDNKTSHAQTQNKIKTIENQTNTW